MKGLLLGLTLFSCTILPDPIVPPPSTCTGTLCECACERMEEQKCPGWEGSATKTCVEVCDYYEAIPEASFCPKEVAKMRGNPDGSCNEEELSRAFSACEGY
jgi:hypothetical protein